MSTSTLGNIATIPARQRDSRECAVCAAGGSEARTPAVVKVGEGSLASYGSGRALCAHCAVVPTTGEEQARALAAVLNAYEERPWVDSPQGAWEDVLLLDGIQGEIDWDASDDVAGPVTLRSGHSVSWIESRDRWVAS